MSSDAIKLGEAFVKIGADAKELDLVIKGTSKKIESFGKQAVNVANAIAIGWGACQAAIVGVTKHFAAVGDQLDKMAARTGVSAQTLSQWSYAAGQCGTSIENVDAAMSKLSKNIINGSDKFAQLGLSIENLKNLSPEMQFMSVAQAISQLDSSTQQAALATSLFGGAGASLLPMLKQGTDGITYLSDKANQLGIVMDSVATTRAAAMNDAYDNLSKTVSGLSITMGNALAPVVIDITNSIAQHVGAIIKWTDANSGIISGIADVVSNVLGLTTSVIGVYGAYKAWLAITAGSKVVYALAAGGINSVISSFKTLRSAEQITAAAWDYLTKANLRNFSALTRTAVICRVSTIAETAHAIALKMAGTAAVENKVAQIGLTVASYAGALGVNALSAAWLFFQSISPLGWIMAIGAAVVGLTAYLFGGESATTQYAKAMSKLREENDNTRKTHELYAQRLEQLNKKEELSDKEKAETRKMVEELNAKYKDLGLSIDPVTGKIVDASGKFVTLRQVMQKAAETDLNNELEALGNQLDELQNKLTDGDISIWRKIGTFITFGYVDNAEEIQQKIDETKKKMEEANQSKTQQAIESDAYSDEYNSAEQELNDWQEKDRRDNMSESERKIDDIKKEFSKRRESLQLLINEMRARKNLTDAERRTLAERENMLKSLNSEEERRIHLIEQQQEAASAEELSNVSDKLKEMDEKAAEETMTETEKKIAAIHKEFEERKKLLEQYIETAKKKKELSEAEQKELAKRQEQLKNLEAAEQARIDALQQAEEAQKEANKQAELASLDKSYNDRRQAEKDKALEQKWNDMTQQDPNNAVQIANDNVAKLESAKEDAYNTLREMIQSGATDEEKKAQKEKIDMMENELAVWNRRRDDVTIGRLRNAQPSAFSQPSIAVAGSLDAQRKFLENQQANKGNPMVKIGEEQVNWLEKIFNQQVNLNNNFSLEGV